MNEEPRRLSAYGNVKIKRRKPRHLVFVKGLIIFAAAMVFVTAACGVLLWKYIGMSGDSDPDIFVKELISETDADGWKQLLRKYLPDTYPEYENASDLAYKVLSPGFNVGNVTWLRRANPEAPEYMLFSNGIRFAVMKLKDTSDSKIGLGQWEIETVSFDIGYFGLDFPETVIICPEQGVLSINGVQIGPEYQTGSVAYPALSPGEEKGGPACVSYGFDDLWFAPGLSCTYNGQELECVRDDTNRYYYFVFPESEVHSITVTVPSGVTAYVGGTQLTEEWADSVQKEGKLGSLDDGGTGTLPILTVWTVEGLFAETSVRAEVYGKEVELLSSENGNYVFDTPAECKYTVTVCVPKGAVLKVNGKTIGSNLSTALSISESGSGGTVLGSYDVADLAAVEAAVPDFDKYELSGYLALPNVSVTYNGTELSPCYSSTDSYDVIYEYDYLSSDSSVIDAERVEGARSFAEAYIAYTSGGGAWNNKQNEENFNANYETLKSMMIEGTSGYVSVMESYRTVNRMQHYDTFSVSNFVCDECIVYTDNCISCRVTCDVVRTTETVEADGYTSSVGNTVSVEMHILQVLYKGEWRIWGFTYEAK